MSRSVIIFFSLSLVLVSLFGVGNPDTSVEWLMAATNQLDGLRIGVAAALVAFGVLLPIESRLVRYALRMVGLLMFAILAGSWFYPDAFLERGLHLHSLDIVTLLEGTVMCLLLSMYQSDDPAVLPQFIEQAGSGPTPQPPVARPV